MTSQPKTILKSYFNTGDIPTESNFADLIDTIGQATLTVAALDASAASRGRSDYICDGINDEVQIQEAIDALPAAGGRVLLTEGNFNLYAAGFIANTHGNMYYCVAISPSHGPITIQGIPGATVLKLADNQQGGTIMLYIYGSRLIPRTVPTYVFGLWFDGNYPNNISAVYYTYGAMLTGHFTEGVTVRYCRFKNPRYFGIQFCYISPNNVVANCYFEGEGGVRSEAYNLIVSSCVFNLDNVPHGLESFGVTFGPDSDEAYPNPPGGTYLNYGSTIVNNIFKGGGSQLGIATSLGNTIIGNVFSDFYGPYGYAVMIYSTGTGYNVVAGNTFYNVTNGVWLYNGTHHNLFSNNIFLAGQDRAMGRGIYEQSLPNAPHDNQFIGNIFQTNDAAITSIAANGDMARDNLGWITEAGGAAAALADGGTIDHGLVAVPTWANVSASVAGEMATVTSLDATHITVAIKKHDGTPGTAQTVYWEAKV